MTGGNMASGKNWFEIAVIIILLLNTLLLGGIWCTLKCKSCGYGKAGVAKICPITGKSLQSPDAVKGSPQ